MMIAAVVAPLRHTHSTPQPLLLAARSFAKAAAKKNAKVKPQKINMTLKKKAVEASDDKHVDLPLILAALDAPMRQEPTISEEERERRYQIGRNYVIGKFRQHNEIHHDLACKLQLKNHAIRMLPKNTKLREEALKIDESGPPSWRHHPVWTPPIPGFDPTQFTMTEEDW